MTPVSASRIAIVDDEPTIRETVSLALRREGYSVLEYADGLTAWEAFAETLPDVVILDILMPRMDGLELCRRLRSVSRTLPILFLTSRHEEFDRVLGLELGADDYLCKPFSLRELVARVKVVLRRLSLLDEESRQADELLAVGGLELDLMRYLVRWRGAPVQLTVTEFMLLRALARRPGHVKSRAQLMQEAYPHDAYVSERTIDTHVKRLRKKFAVLDAGFEAIETVYGIGYRLREPETS